MYSKFDEVLSSDKDMYNYGKANASLCYTVNSKHRRSVFIMEKFLAGYKLKSGDYRTEHVSEDELWSAFAYLFSAQSQKSSSYKFGFLKAIIDNLYNVDENLTLTFDQLFSKFGEIYWNLILKYNLKQQSRKETYVEQIIKNAAVKYNLPTGVPYESLTSEMMIDISHQVKMKCKNNVVGALYGDTKALFYSFDKNGEWLQINPQMYEFICKHKVAIEKINYYEWARFLESVNDESVVNHLLSKIDESAKRNNLSYYRDILFQEFENKCFYCGKKVTKAHVDVDHFIPWSFIKDDNIWNFVLACPECNRKKSDKLATQKYLDNLIVRNSNIKIESFKGMENYRQERLLKIYAYAFKNGYNDIWVPNKKVEC